MRFAIGVAPLILSLAIVAGPSIAKAADLDEGVIRSDTSPVSGWYFAARLGAVWAEDSDFRFDNGAVVPFQISNVYEQEAFTGMLAFGASFGGGFRGEVEFGYSNFDIAAQISDNGTTVRTWSGASAFGNTRSFTGLINGYYDVEFGEFSPFVGAGIGIGHVEFDNHGLVLPGPIAGLPAGPNTLMNDSGNGLAWQIGAGLSYELLQGIDVEIGYRYSGIENVGLTAMDGTSSDVDLRNHSVILGVRMAF